MSKQYPKRISILVAEDYEPFRRLVSLILEPAPELQIVSEVSDGQLAVQAAQEMQPDIILMDIGLPTLNGLEAAQQIRTISPRSKILFVTQESSLEVIQKGFRLGAWAYVLKTDAEAELLTAIRLVVNWQKFASSGCLQRASRLGQADAGTPSAAIT